MSLRGDSGLAALRRFCVSAFTVFLVVTAAILAFGGLTMAVYLYCNQSPNLPPAAVVSAAGFATLGWLVTAANQRSLSRKQHTLNLLIQMRHAEVYLKRVAEVTTLSGQGLPLTPDLVKLATGQRKPKADNVAEKAFSPAVGYVLNYWEFVSAAVIVGDLDAELIRRTVRQHIVSCHDKFAAKIDYDQRNGKKKVYEHLRKLANEWRTPEEARRLEELEAKPAVQSGAAVAATPAAPKASSNPPKA